MYVNADFSQFGDEKSGNPGTTLLKMVQLEIGGQRIDRYYNDWLETWTELTQVILEVWLLVLHTMIPEVLYIKKWPVRWSHWKWWWGYYSKWFNDTFAIWFCRNVGLVIIVFNITKLKLISLNEKSGLEERRVTVDSAIFVGRLYLPRYWWKTSFRSSFYEYQSNVQRISTTNSSQVELNFNHPVKELIWMGNL